MNDRPQDRLPEISIRVDDDVASDGLPPTKADADGTGLRAGLQTGFLVGPLVGLVGMASMASQGRSDLSWVPMVAWVAAGILLGGIIGWAAGLVVGPTQRELAGGIAGAVLGLSGGVFYSPLVGHLISPLKDPGLETLRRAVIGGLFGLVIGAGLGIFHRLLRPRRRRYLSGRYISVAEQELEIELNKRTGAGTGFWN